MDIKRLYLGHIGGPLGPATPFHAYLIPHPQGAILVDTGFGTAMGNDDGPAGELVFGDLRMPWLRRPTTVALADHGLEAGDIKYIVNTHLNDHGGENYLFPEATFIVQKPEWEWLAESPARAAWDFDGAKVELLDSEDAEILAGVTCLFTPGHTPGHQSVLLEDGGTKTLFLGDAAYTNAIWDDPEQIAPGHPAWMMQVQIPDARDVWLQSVEKLHDVQPDVMHFAHDPEVGHKH